MGSAISYYWPVELHSYASDNRHPYTPASAMRGTSTPKTSSSGYNSPPVNVADDACGHMYRSSNPLHSASVCATQLDATANTTMQTRSNQSLRCPPALIDNGPAWVRAPAFCTLRVIDGPLTVMMGVMQVAGHLRGTCERWICRSCGLLQAGRLAGKVLARGAAGTAEVGVCWCCWGACKDIWRRQQQAVGAQTGMIIWVERVHASRAALQVVHQYSYRTPTC
jgi:hypothetical protein